MRDPRILVLHAPGTNRDREAALACEMAGGQPEIVHINQLAAGERELAAYEMMVLPGGFSYGDDLGAGRLWATDLELHVRAQMDAFVAIGKPVLGICNGFARMGRSQCDADLQRQRPIRMPMGASPRADREPLSLPARPGGRHPLSGGTRRRAFHTQGP